MRPGLLLAAKVILRNNQSLFWNITIGGSQSYLIGLKSVLSCKFWKCLGEQVTFQPGEVKFTSGLNDSSLFDIYHYYATKKVLSFQSSFS